MSRKYTSITTNPDIYGDESWQTISSQMEEQAERDKRKNKQVTSKKAGKKLKKDARLSQGPAKSVTDLSNKTTGKLNRKGNKSQKAKSWLSKVMSKLKIRRGGGMGGTMPVTDQQLKKIGARRSKVN